MLRVVATKLQGSWDEYLELVEFSHNNNYQASIQMTPFKALYDWKSQNLICWDEAVTLSPELLMRTTKHVRMICKKLKVAKDR